MKTVINGGDAVKTLARRDSCTALLKKLGIAPSEYNQFIWATTDGRYAVSLEKAQAYLDSKLVKVAKAVVQGRNKGSTPKAAESNQIKKPTVAATIRRMILDGKENADIFVVLQRDFGFDEEKKHYPAWYRSQMRREGLIARPDKKEKKPKVEKPAKVKKAPVDRTKPVKKKASKVVSKARKAAIAKAAAKVRKSSQAQSNINATAAASFKTGNKSERVAPLKQINL